MLLKASESAAPAGTWRETSNESDVMTRTTFDATRLCVIFLIGAGAACSVASADDEGVDGEESATGQAISTPFSIIVRSSGKCLDVANGSTADGTRILQWACTGVAHQSWAPQLKSDGFETLVSKGTGKCIHVESDNRSVVQRSCDASASQLWKRVTAAPGFVGLVNKRTGLCLDVEGESLTDGARLIQWTCKGSTNQHFTVPAAGSPALPDAGTPTPDAGGGPGTRNPLKWPFASNSIWNMPVGSGAVYVPGQIQPPSQYGMTTDEDIVIMRPTAPLTRVMLNTAGWSQRDRCPPDASNQLLMQVPIPTDYLFGDKRPSTPNAGTAILLADGRTVKQTQPFSRCVAGGPATSQYFFPDADLKGDGIRGAHGGSGLSTLGGTLRIGELTRASGSIRHVLKVNLDGAMNFRNCSTREDCFRWPAVTGDAYAVDRYGSLRSGPVAMRMGALLALPRSLNLANLGLETEPARRLAWTFQNYGAYVVDDTAWRVYALVVEVGPDGDVRDEFRREWGFPLTEASQNTPWTRDMRRIMTALAVIDNNGPSSVGGGGTPLQPLAPALP
jgi:hypothetical protein